jgi:hypothetical protein
MAGVPLSDETEKRLSILFSGEDARIAREVLVKECGSNLPFCENYGPSELERLRFAALKLSAGKLDLLAQAVELAKQDWRDLLVAADFGDDSLIHKHWLPEKPSQ